MELRICFMHSVFCIMVFAILPICSVNYDAQLAIKMKEMDMARAMKRNSVPQRADTPNLDDQTLQPSKEALLSRFTMKSDQIVTRCTTSKPLPKLNPYYLPTSEELDDKSQRSNSIGSGDEENKVNHKKYIAPVPGKNPFHYIDDEK